MIFRGFHRSDRPFGDLGGARTLDPLIKSQLLYQLSYEVIVWFACANLRVFFGLTKYPEDFF